MIYFQVNVPKTLVIATTSQNPQSYEILGKNLDN